MLTSNLIYGTALTPTTNPNPNTLTTKAPYLFTGTSRIIGHASRCFKNPAWVTQAKQALACIFISNDEGFPGRGYFRFKPNGGPSEVRMWIYNPNTNDWGIPEATSNITVTADSQIFVEDVPNTAIYFEVISGNVDIYYASSVFSGCL